jgi:antitoxin (DNA-binding transcriptional repressor) of toxin-antitoxin stability system
MCHILCHIQSMPTINLRELRDTRQLVKWLDAGEVVELKKRDRVVAKIVPESPRIQPVKMPDFAARRRAIFGDRTINAVEMLIEDREDRF